MQGFFLILSVLLLLEGEYGWGLAFLICALLDDH